MPPTTQTEDQQGSATNEETNMSERRKFTADELKAILEEHRKWRVTGGREGSHADLAHANLTDAYLAGANLAHANLADANLAHADLTDACLAGADLAGANLTDAYLAGANLAHANLADAYLAGANLAHANLADANLAHADLADAYLAGANLAHANLTDAYLAGANLTDAYLAGANLAHANLTDANLAHADLADADLAGANLAHANLTDAYLAGADLAGADLARADLAGAYLAGADLAHANLAGADLAHANLAGADLAGADLTGARNVPAGIEKTDPPTHYVRQAPTPEVLAERAKAYRERHPEAPVVEALDSKILAAISSGGVLEMASWHGEGGACGTTHCRAGWAIHLAGEAGAKLEAEHGPERAGAMIYRASTGRVPHFYATNSRALEDIRECAEREKAAP